MVLGEEDRIEAGVFGTRDLLAQLARSIGMRRNVCPVCADHQTRAFTVVTPRLSVTDLLAGKQADRLR
jgi:hypothetical protein